MKDQLALNRTLGAVSDAVCYLLSLRLGMKRLSYTGKQVVAFPSGKLTSNTTNSLIFISLFIYF